MEGTCQYILKTGNHAGAKCGQPLVTNDQCYQCYSRDMVVTNLHSMGYTDNPKGVCRHTDEYSGEPCVRPEVCNGYCLMCLARY